jgi:hypothetical protein
MPCNHKFLNHNFHYENSLFPNWNAETLIIGTFNPSNDFHSENTANYYYGRSKYFWKLLPIFNGRVPILENEIDNQREFLVNNKIALTDLLISINDANVENQIHINRIKTVKDIDIELFNDFTWNTDNIKEFIVKNNIQQVYFTFLSNINKQNVLFNTFEFQTRLIESFCLSRNISTYRLHTPSGQGLGSGSPRLNKLINKWYFENGANNFLFINDNFEINNYRYM